LSDGPAQGVGVGLGIFQRLAKPGPADLGKDRIRSYFEVYIRIDVGDNPRASLPRRLPGRIMQNYEAPTGDNVVAEFHIDRLGESERCKSGRRWCFSDAELWPVL